MLEDILKSGVYDLEEGEMEDVEKAIAKRLKKRKRKELPSYSCQQKAELVGNVDITEKEANVLEAQVENVGGEGDEEADSQFQQLYEELQSCATGQGPLTYQFEKIYEDLAMVESSSPPASSSSSFLPPEIYRLHTEGHSQRMGILTKYVETGRSYSSLASPEEGEPLYDIWSPGEGRGGGWCTVGGGSSVSGSPFPPPSVPQSPFANSTFMASSPFPSSPVLSPLSLWPQSHTERLDFIPARCVFIC